VARIEAVRKDLDIRHAVADITLTPAERLQMSVYCASRPTDELIKRRNGQLASDRTGELDT